MGLYPWDGAFGTYINKCVRLLVSFCSSAGGAGSVSMRHVELELELELGSLS